MFCPLYLRTIALTLKMGRVRAAHFVGVEGFVMCVNHEYLCRRVYMRGKKYGLLSGLLSVRRIEWGGIAVWNRDIHSVLNRYFNGLIALKLYVVCHSTGIVTGKSGEVA